MPNGESHLPILGFLLLYSSIFAIRAWADSPVEGTLLFIMNTFGLYKTFEQTNLPFGLFISSLMVFVTWYCYQYIHFFTLDMLNIGFFYVLALCQIEARFPLTRGNIEYFPWLLVIIGHCTQAILLNSWIVNHNQQYYQMSQALNALGKSEI
jgi:hypothetical protein